MNVTMVTSSLSRAGGGIFEISRRIAQELAVLPDTTVRAVGMLDDYSTADQHLWQPVPTIACPTVGPRKMGWAPGMQRALQATQPDILHQHGIWQLPSVATTAWARRHRRPYVVHVHGMLDPWAVRNSAWKKRAALLAYQRRHLEGAGCLIVNTRQEARAVRDLGIKSRVVVLKNGVDIAEGVGGPPPWADHIGRDRRILLYLGRLHPKKGLNELVNAWARVRQQARTADEWSLVIAGWDDGGHEPALRRIASDLGLRGSELYFAGALHGSAKTAAMAQSDAFILPSHSEGLPMAALEALACGLPVLVTPACNIPEVFSVDAGMEISPDPDSIADGLCRLFARSADERRDMGERGRELVRAEFSWQDVSAKLRRVYAWLLGGPCPHDLLDNV